VAPAGGAPKIGTEVAVDRGELGYVAESQLVAAKEDLTSADVRARIKPGSDPLAGFPAALLAPLVFDQETLGMVALSRPRRIVGVVADRLLPGDGPSQHQQEGDEDDRASPEQEQVQGRGKVVSGPEGVQRQHTGNDSGLDLVGRILPGVPDHELH